MALDEVSVLPHQDDEKVLFISLQRLHRTLFRTERFKVWFTPSALAHGPLTNIYQASTFITKSDAPLYDSEYFAQSSDALPEHDGSDLFEGLDDSPVDADETTFMDLFTEPESSKDTEYMVCGCLIPAARL